jgi:hypothetical protein
MDRSLQGKEGDYCTNVDLFYSGECTKAEFDASVAECEDFLANLLEGEDGGKCTWIQRCEQPDRRRLDQPDDDDDDDADDDDDDFVDDEECPPEYRSTWAYEDVKRFEWPCSACREALEGNDFESNKDAMCAAGGGVEKFKTNCLAADFDAFKLGDPEEPLTHAYMTAIYGCLCDYAIHFESAPGTTTCADLDAFMTGDCTWEQFSSMWGEEEWYVDEGMESKEDAKAFMAKMKELSC